MQCSINSNHSFNGATTFQPWKCKSTVVGLISEKFLLQWGHDFSAVEMFREGATIKVRISDASMGPRLFSRGNVDGEIVPGFQRTLQWGHDFSAVEIISFDGGWDMEKSFNGATTFQPWKFPLEIVQECLDALASMGPRLFSRGNVRKDGECR